MPAMTGEARGGPSPPGRPWRLSRSDLALCAVAVVASGGFSVWLGQDLNFDLLWYHFYNGYALVHGRLDQDIAPVGWHTYLNPLLDVGYYLGMVWLPSRAFGFLLGALHGLNFGLLYLLGRCVFGGSVPRHARPLALLGALVGSLGANGISLLGTTMGNNLLSLLVLGGLLAMVWPGAGGRSPFEESPWPRSRLIVAGVLVGAATALKLTALVELLGLAVSLLVLAFWSQSGREIPKVVAWFGVGSLIGFAAVGGHWSWRLFTRFENPIFPFANQLFRSPFFATEPYRDSRWMANGLWDYVRPPLDIALGRMDRLQEIGARDGRFLVLFTTLVVFGLFALVLSRRGKTVRATPPERFLAIFWLVGYVLWAAVFYYYRYLTSLELLAPLVTFIFVRAVLPARALVPVVLVLSVGLGAWVRTDSWGRGDWQEDWFGVDLPPRARRPGALVLLLGGPIAFSIPSFPADARFAHLTGIQDKGGTVLIDQMIEEAVRAHEGPLLVLATFRVDASAQDPAHRRPRWVYDPERDAAPSVAPLGLTLTDRCDWIRTRGGRLYLCDLDRRVCEDARNGETAHP